MSLGVCGGATRRFWLIGSESKCLGPRSPDIVIVDGQELLYHVTWSCGGDPSVLVASMKARLASLPGEWVLVFDRYDHLSPKDHERMRRTGVGSTNYNIAINSLLPSRDAILKNKHNKRQLNRVLSTFDMGAAVTIDTQDTGVFGHEEADVTIISYVLQAVGEGKNVVRVLCDDTDVFVLLAFWMWRNQLVDTCQMQMERRDGAVLNINQTCTKLGSTCLQLLGIHALTGCHTTSFPFNKGNVSALSVLAAGDFPGLFNVLGKEDAMQWTFIRLDCHSFVHCTARNQAHPWKRRGITCTQRRRPRPGFAIVRRIAPTCFFLCNGPICSWHCGRQVISIPAWYRYQQLRMGDEGWHPFTVYRSWTDKASALSWTWLGVAFGLQGKHVPRSAAVRRKVSPARFTAYVNPGMNDAILTRGRSTWMMRTKRTASRRSMKLWMLTVLLIASPL